MSEWDDFSAPADDWDSFSKVVTADKPTPKKRKRSLVEDVTGAMANVNRGLAIGDELAAAGGVVTGLFTGRHKLTDPVVPAFKAELATQRGREDSFATDRPRVAALARGTGNALTMAAPVGPGAQAFATGGKAVNALRGATVAGLTGAGYAAVDRGTLGERVAAASKAATDPLTLTLGAAGGALAAPRAQKAPSPQKGAEATVERLKARRKDAYDDVEASGFRFTPENINDLADTIETEVRTRGGPKGAKAFPDADAMVARLRALAAEPDGPTIPQLDLLRRDIYDVLVAPEGKEAFLGKIMRGKIDDMTKALDAPFIQEARAANIRYEKAGAVADRVRSAELAAGRANSGENFGNALRQKISPLIDPLHSAEIGNLTPAEAAGLERVVIGDPTQNALRTWSNRLRSPMWTGTATTPAALLGFAGGGPGGGAAAAGLTAAGMQGVGQVLRRAAEARTSQNVQAVLDLIEAGGEVGATAIRLLATDPAYAELRQQLANDLAVQAGVQGASAASAR